MDGHSLSVMRSYSGKSLAIGGTLMILAGLVAFALLREVRTTVSTDEKTSAFQDAPRKAFSAEEERFAQALLSIHEQVKSSAVTMIFAGITYKTGGLKRAEFIARIRPAAASIASAQAQFAKLSVPTSLRALGAQYAEALRLYRRSVEETLKVGVDGDDSHLLAAHEISQRASNLLLEVGEQLWPGEYKPN